MTHETLYITVESTADFFAAARSDLRRLKAGDEMADEYVVSLPDETALERVLSAKHLELLRTIVRDSPDSMRALARLVDRNPKNVSISLHRLADLGLVRLEADGRAKRPVVWYDEIAVDIPLSGDESEAAVTA